ncbi:MAG: hypothetical protein ACKOUM_00720 [Sphingopyxis sp.]
MAMVDHPPTDNAQPPAQRPSLIARLRGLFGMNSTDESLQRRLQILNDRRSEMEAGSTAPTPARSTTSGWWKRYTK